MNSVERYLLNAIWAATLTPGALGFWSRRQTLKESQAVLLRNYLKRNANTRYGKRFKFDRIRSPREFQDQVPLTTYDLYQQDINDIAAGAQNVLTSDRVLLFELSSGSSAASKYVPYTAELKQEFQRGLAPWISNLFREMPSLMGGEAYWSISPACSALQRTSANIPIGFDDDSAYLGGFAKRVVSRLLVVPQYVSALQNIENVRYVTLLFLLNSRQLRLISVWSPTFLSLMLERLPRWWESLLGDLSRGTLSLPYVENGINSVSAPQSSERVAELASLRSTQFDRIWPKLALISCWTDGPSEHYAAKLAESFPKVAIQGKGLLATEAMVTFPLVGVLGGVLSALSHFFEFIPQSGDRSRCVLADEIEVGERYAVVVTTGGGLYRYQLHDIVEVVGRWYSIPTLRFIGKEDRVCDRFGEKLSDAFVQNSLTELFASLGISPRFSLVAPEVEGYSAWYTLFIELERDYWILQQRIAALLDTLLQRNYHYRYCRELGQLQLAKVHFVRDGLNRFIKRKSAENTRWGAIKSQALDVATDWREVFERFEPQLSLEVSPQAHQ